MRTMMTVTIPVEAGNQATQTNRMGPIIERAVELMKPEAVYFTTANGQRQGIFVFDLADQSDIPAIAEPIFQELKADISLSPVMNMDDLAAGLAKWTT